MEPSMITVRSDRHHLGLLTTGVVTRWSARCTLPGCDWSTLPERFAGYMTAGQHLDQLLEHLAEAHEPDPGHACARRHRAKQPAGPRPSPEAA
jgi:hypothetical protein